MKLFALLFLIFSQVAWADTAASEAAPEAEFSDSLGQLSASFTGDLPFTSCSGIHYQIDLFADRVFFRHMTYLDEGKNFDAVGSWDVSPDGNTVILKDGDKAPDLFAIKDQSTIRKLDLDGNEIESALNYDLNRTASFQPIEPKVATAHLENTYWKLLHLGDKPVVMHEQEREPHFILGAQDHRVSGSGGCNRLMGGYELKGNNLVFHQMASTMMACLDGMDTEQAFLAVLAQVRTWKIIGEHLELFDASGNQVALLESRYLQ